MIRNYLKIAWRNLQKNKVFSLINILGLTVGLTCCLLITLFIFHETRYDRHYPNGDRLYQLTTLFINEGERKLGANSSGPVGRMIQQSYPEVEASTRLMRLWRDDKTLLQVKSGNNLQSFYETKGFLADSNLFQVLSYEFAEGDPRTALQSPNTVVISDVLARKLFGNSPALNQPLHISSGTHGDQDARVSGVFRVPKTPTQLDANFFMPFRGGNMDGMANDNPSMVNNNMFFTYLLLKPGSNGKQLEAKMPAFVAQHMGQELKASGRDRNYLLTPITGVHLAGLEGLPTASGNKTTLFILGSIAALTLLIACINFMNLSTSSSSRRAAEVGVRKVLGAQRQSLLKQFLGESLLMAFIAFFFALLFSFLLFPFFQQVAGQNIVLTVEQVLPLLAGFVGLTILTGLLAGSYPALYLSAFKPIKVLKGRFTNSLAAANLRKGLVVFQFIISIALIVASLVIARQMKYLRSKDLGFVKDQQIVIPLRSAAAKENIAAFRSEMTKAPGVRSIGTSMTYPGIEHPQDWGMFRQGQTKEQSKTIYINLIDDNFLQTLGVKLVAGRLFSREFPADTLTRFVVNEETVKQFGFGTPQEAIGKWLAFEWEGEQHTFTIVGVIKNFHFKDLHEEIKPLAFRLYNEAGFNYLIAHAEGSRIQPALTTLQGTWKKLNPDEPFEYSFVDQDFQKNYETESRQASLINYFTFVAIIISCLGLFGLATFTAEQRTKEIGVRKVLGASVMGVVGLLSRDFLKLVILALLIASPLAWWGMNKWLQNFAYQTNLSWPIFAITAVLALVIAFGTISFQAVKAALANPVKSLRTE